MSLSLNLIFGNCCRAETKEKPMKVLTGCQKGAIVTDFVVASLAIGIGALALSGIDLAHLAKIGTIGQGSAWIFVGAGSGVILLNISFVAVLKCRSQNQGTAISPVVSERSTPNSETENSLAKEQPKDPHLKPYVKLSDEESRAALIKALDEDLIKNPSYQHDESGKKHGISIKISVFRPYVHQYPKVHLKKLSELLPGTSDAADLFITHGPLIDVTFITERPI